MTPRSQTVTFPGRTLYLTKDQDLLRQQLYGIGAGDPLTFALAILLVAAVAATAAMLPARRALI